MTGFASLLFPFPLFPALGPAAQRPCQISLTSSQSQFCLAPSCPEHFLLFSYTHLFSSHQRPSAVTTFPGSQPLEIVIFKIHLQSPDPTTFRGRVATPAHSSHAVCIKNRHQQLGAVLLTQRPRPLSLLHLVLTQKLQETPCSVTHAYLASPCAPPLEKHATLQ